MTPPTGDDPATTRSSRELADLLLERGKRRFAEASDATWLHEFATTCDDEAGGDLHALRGAAVGLAWWVRTCRGQGPPAPTEPVDPRPATAETPYFELAFTGHLLRTDFRCEALRHYLGPCRRERDRDAFVDALWLFAQLGRGEAVPEDDIDAVLAAPDSDTRARHCVLHALWIAGEQNRWAPKLVEVGERMEGFGDANDVLHYRLATGHRRLGHYQDALRHIRLAMSSPTVDNLVREQLHAEFERIVAAQDAQQRMDAIEHEAQRKLDALREEAEAKVRSTLRDGLIANFALLTVATAMIGQTGISGVAMVRAAQGRMGWGSAFALGGFAFAFVVAVLILVRIIVEGGAVAVLQRFWAKRSANKSGGS